MVGLSSALGAEHFAVHRRTLNRHVELKGNVFGTLADEVRFADRKYAVILKTNGKSTRELFVYGRFQVLVPGNGNWKRRRHPRARPALQEWR